jgi:hypothetical protein
VEILGVLINMLNCILKPLFVDTVVLGQPVSRPDGCQCLRTPLDGELTSGLDALLEYQT